jgi:hypothetical protein
MKAIHLAGALKSLLRPAPVMVVSVLVLLASCGSDDCLQPSISSLSPNTATAGGPQFTLTVDGNNFGSSSVLLWNGSRRATTVLSVTRLTAIILASDIAGPGTAHVKINNPGIGGFACFGGDSSSLPFTISP